MANKIYAKQKTALMKYTPLLDTCKYRLGPVFFLDWAENDSNYSQAVLFLTACQMNIVRQVSLSLQSGESFSRNRPILGLNKLQC